MRGLPGGATTIQRGQRIKPGRPLPACARHLRQAYRLLRTHFGHQHWWPANTAFEVCVGAILTQNTSWTNVERALAQLRKAGVFDPHSLWELPEGALAQLLRPAGYFNVKARRLRAFLAVLSQQHGGSVTSLLDGPTEVVRHRLLSIPGIGPETADSMLLYAGGHCRFVVDAYTRRIFQRHGWCPAQATYAELQDLCERTLTDRAPRRRLDYWQDYHAQLVRVGKDHCKSRQPRCDQCPLRSLLPPLSKSPLGCRGEQTSPMPTGRAQG